MKFLRSGLLGLFLLMTLHTSRICHIYAAQTFIKLANDSRSNKAAYVDIQQTVPNTDGTVIVSGVFREAADFGGGVTIGPLAENTFFPFIAKQDANGVWIWARAVFGTAGTPATRSTTSLSVKSMTLSTDAIYLAGTQATTPGATGNGFLIKTDLNGTVIWIRDFVATSVMANAVVLAPNGNICVGGHISSGASLTSSMTIYSGATALSTLSIGQGRNAFLIQLSPTGSVVWSSFSGSPYDTSETVAALASDGLHIHVLMNLKGTAVAPASIQNANGTNYRGLTGNVAGQLFAFVGAVDNDGQWQYFNVLDSLVDLGAFAPGSATVLAITQEITGTDIQLIGGKIYVAGSYSATGLFKSGSFAKGGFLLRLKADTLAADGTVAYFKDPNDTVLSYPARIRGTDNEIFVTGPMSTTLNVYTEIPLAPKLGTFDASVTSVGPNRFLGKFDQDLNPIWLQTTSSPSTIIAPGGGPGSSGSFLADTLGFDSVNQRLYWGGSFKTIGNENLAFGNTATTIAQFTTERTGFASPDKWGWLTALDAEGKFLSQATLRVESTSTRQPVNINGVDVTPPVELTVFPGGSTRLTVRTAESNGIREIADGYSINNVPAAATGDDVLLDVLDDISIKFRWKTQYLLTVTSEHAAAGMNAASAPGNPEPSIGLHWIDEGTVVNPTIDGIVLPADFAQFGSRYVVSSYDYTQDDGRSAAGNGGTDQRIGLPPLSMGRPKSITYRWRRQFSIKANHTADSARQLLMVRRVNAAGAEVPGSRVNSSGGEFWMDANSSVQIGALNADGSISLKGWKYATPLAYFPSTTFTVSLDVSDDTQELASVLESSGQYWTRLIPSLTQPVNILWDYGDTIYPFHVGIGEQLNLSANPATASITGRWTNARVLEGPPGSTGDDMLVWDQVAGKAMPVRPGTTLVDWTTTSGSRVVTQIYAGFRNDPYPDDSTKRFTGPNEYNHVASTPPVDLDPDPKDERFFKELKFTTGDGIAVGDEFTATVKGKSVLLFTTSTTGAAVGDIAQEKFLVRVVNTFLWNSQPGIFFQSPGRATATVGQRVTSVLDRASLGTGYVINELSNYNPDVYDREHVKGPIIPVNNPVVGKYDSPQSLIVVWYERVDSILWPASPVWYDSFLWPAGPRIVIASRLGSEGLDNSGNSQLILDPAKYSDVKIYNQPDRTKPGYNPNEEHARIYPSLYQGLSGKNVPAAFALRNDLNITFDVIQKFNLSSADYTSDSYVLVQYNDNTGPQPEAKMAVYKVEQEDPGLKDPRVLELPGAAAGVSNYVFRYSMKAGELITAPYPLNLVIGLNPCINTADLSQATPNGSYFEDRGSQRTWFVDHKLGAWAVSGDSSFTARYYYQLAPDFWYPFDLTADISVTENGDCIPFLPRFEPGANAFGVFDSRTAISRIPSAVRYNTAWPANLPILKIGETLTYAGGENKADNPDDPGLPGVIGFAAGEIVFDSKNPTMVPIGHFNNYMARLISPLEERLLSFPTGTLPANLNNPASPDVTVDGDTWSFNKLPPSLQRRVFFKPLAKLNSADQPGVLGLRGYVNDRTLGAPDLTAAPPPVYVLEPNVLTASERDALKAVGNGNPTWNTQVDALYALSRNPHGLSGSGWNVGLEPTPAGASSPKPLVGLGPGLALVTNPALLDPVNVLATGYVTIAENNHQSLGDAPVTMHIIKVDPAKRYRGAIKTILPPNVFDEKITLRHTADFGGNVDDIAFAWWYHEEDGTVKVGDIPPGPNGNSPAWSPFSNANGLNGQNQIDLDGNPTLLLADNLVFTRYRHKNATAPLTDASWSAWAGAANSSIRDFNGDGKPDYRAQLATGWVKRVLDAINPYEARIREFAKNTSPSTAASMIQQLGGPFTGPVALNASKDVVENLGLIELYETVLKRARDLSIDASQPAATSGINAAILLASTRLAEFYTLLGNEAWDDALDPSIGFGTDSIDHGNLNSTRFCFENQLPGLLDEELGLLRGVDESFGRPVYNRLFWNFTKGEGEVAYALNYQIKDVNNDGFIDENDAMKLHPMGHGDAWGHFLSAMRKRYDLLNAPNFQWEARSEYYNLLDVVLGVDFLDESTFARTAAARAKVGAEIVNLTFRSRYLETTDAKISGYTDSNPDRAWGVTEWARRAGQAAVFDWITANAILPPRDADSLEPESKKIDRTTVPEIQDISTQLAGIQGTLESANSGMNSIGLDPDVLPFDIDPTHIDVGSTAQIGRAAVQGLSHFEQIFERAFEAMKNADVSFRYANDQKARERQVAQSAEQLRKQAIAQDLDFRNRLIEIFGTPYEGQIGAGKAYPAGYAGPDLNLFMYVDVNAITSDTVPSADNVTYFDEYTSFYSLTNDLPAEFALDIGAHFLDDISFEGNTAVELLGDDLVHLKLPATAGDYTFVAPESWGQRAAPGQLQTLVSEMLQVESDLTLAVGDYDFLIKQLRDKVALLQMRADIDTEILGIKDERYNTVIGLNTALAASKGVQVTLRTLAELQVGTFEASRKSFPTVAGLAFDLTSVARGAVSAAGVIANFLARTVADAAEVADVALEGSKEIIDLRDEMAIDKKEMSVELRGMLYDVEELLVNEGVQRVKIFSLREQLRGLLDQYRATLQSGVRLLEERRNANVQLAADTQENRYHDMIFRNARHGYTQRYRALFDLAQRYCYMAAKAYDYETNFDPKDRASAQPLLNKIVRARTLGELDEDLPLPGDGLAGIMATLSVNFRAIEGRLGFNNFQLETTEFSLRNEQARRETDSDWKDWLDVSKTDDLWTVPEFRRFCRPFAPRGTPQPGIVLRFSTQIIAGQNFFGRSLGPNDSAYDPTLYATKIRAAGIRLDGYPIDKLARTPYVYLVPAGMDYMTIPNSATLETRAWNVIDQAIPVPFLTGPADLARPDWIASQDTLNGNLNEIRRFSSFRAAVTEDDPALNVTRFIGRSVWNDNWVLIIPGQSMHFDPQIGVDEFINNVRDIKLSFETYGYSGN